jgi:hypothetical protein
LDDFDDHLPLMDEMMQSLDTLALMVPLPLSYNRFATDCAKSCNDIIAQLLQINHVMIE